MKLTIKNFKLFQSFFGLVLYSLGDLLLIFEGV